MKVLKIIAIVIVGCILTAVLMGSIAPLCLFL